MMRSERTQAILKSVEWWDTEAVVDEAQRWFQGWKTQALRIPASQWGAAHRLGAASQGFTGFAEAWEEFLRGPKDREGQRRGGVVDRDKRRRGWGQPRLADDLTMTIARAAEPPASPRMERFDAEARELGARFEGQLQEWRRLRQARRLPRRRFVQQGFQQAAPNTGAAIVPMRKQAVVKANSTKTVAAKKA